MKYAILFHVNMMTLAHQQGRYVHKQTDGETERLRNYQENNIHPLCTLQDENGKQQIPRVISILRRYLTIIGVPIINTKGSWGSKLYNGNPYAQKESLYIETGPGCSVPCVQHQWLATYQMPVMQPDVSFCEWIVLAAKYMSYATYRVHKTQCPPIRGK